MSISSTRYVSIVSGVGAANTVPERELVARLFTGNLLLPPKSFLSFNSADSVGQYFGTDSEEYLRADFYFSFISKSITAPESIQFSRWASTAVAPMVYSVSGNNTQEDNWTSITGGSFVLTMGTHTFTISGLDFTMAASLAAVATIIQTAIRTETGGGALWTSATVSYDASTGGFNLVGGITGDAEISVAAPGSGTDITGTGLLGWVPGSVNTNGSITPGAIWAPGSDIETITETLTNSYQASTNFGSFTFLTNLGLTEQEVVEAATWNFSLNNLFLYSVAVTPENVSDWQAALVSIGGVALTLSPTLSPLQYPEMGPMMVEAATDYDSANSVQNYMFQSFGGLSASVTTDSDADAYDALNVNYYGQTQQAGAQIAFYQQGGMQGPATSPALMNLYVNEIWLKDAATVALMNLLITQTRIPANAQGRGMILNTLQDVVDRALNNGTISSNKTLTGQQQLYITQITKDPLAWHQVAGIGYWLNCVIVAEDNEAKYQLVYSKDDVINFVSGTHTLI